MLDTRFSADLQGDESFTGQDFNPVSPLSTFNPNLHSEIERYRSSDRGDRRVIAALATIDREFAEADCQPAVAFSIPPPAISRAAYADEGFTHSAYFDPTLGTPFSTPRNDAVAASRVGKAFINGIRKAFIKTARKHRKPDAPKAAPCLTAVTIRGLASSRARPAVHTGASQGSSRKAADNAVKDGGASRTSRAKPQSSRWHIPLGEDYRLSSWGKRPTPRRGMTFVNSSCDCWRAQFANLFCTKCGPVLLREVPKQRATPKASRR
jgi:hypothetical protein